MEPTDSLTRLTQAGIDEAVRILAEAFTGDLLMDYLFPGHADRSEELRHFFRANVEFALMAGEVYLDPSSAGVAVWLFPGDIERPVVARENDPRTILKDLLGKHTYERLSSFTQFTNNAHRKLIHGSYCYLMFLAVEKMQQGKGIGSLLIRPVLERADKKRLPCLLDTMAAENIAFYTECDFEVLSEARVCGDGPRAWVMIRRPQP